MLKSQTRNTGIKEAVDEVKTMSLIRWARAQYDEYLKQVMDRKAREDYVRDEGIELGKIVGRAEERAEGRAEGRTEGRTESESRIVVLIGKMTAAGETDKLPQLSQIDFMHEMFEKYGL